MIKSQRLLEVLEKLLKRVAQVGKSLSLGTVEVIAAKRSSL
jgi:hypothetical protein